MHYLGSQIKIGVFCFRWEIKNLDKNYWTTINAQVQYWNFSLFLKFVYIIIGLNNCKTSIGVGGGPNALSKREKEKKNGKYQIQQPRWHTEEG